MSDGPEWFAPRRFGIGAGLPIAWQGWAITAVYVVALVVCVTLWGGHGDRTKLIMIPLTIIFVGVVWRTTRGGWRWRWGEEQ
ncbi:hypothetical protein GCM10022281_07680 [Sphingomonas rosea]|uniref:Uncharacterized protein n=1 Tax=Sphingomonas rosea TaxID=335605 RepID=A0ABP7TSS1_9SPHN